MSDTDIRAWARANGIDVNSRGPVRADVVAAYRDAAPDDVETVEFETDTGTAVLPVTPESVHESKPGVKRNLRDRLKSGRAPRAPRTGRAPRRTSIANVVGLSWTGLAQFVERAGMVPVGRCMAFQAPVAGAVLDESLRGTVVDRVLQPFARMGDKAGDLGALMAPPLLTGVIASRPDLAPQLMPMLEEALYRYVEIAGPQVAKIQARREAREAQFGESVQSMLAAIFAPIEQPAAPPEQDGAQPQPRVNGRFVRRGETAHA